MGLSGYDCHMLNGIKKLINSVVDIVSNVGIVASISIPWRTSSTPWHFIVFLYILGYSLETNYLSGVSWSWMTISGHVYFIDHGEGSGKE